MTTWSVFQNPVTYIDHQALVSTFIPYIKSQIKEILSRWHLQMSQYLPNVTLQYRLGSISKAADAFSRAPVGKAVSGLISETLTVFHVGAEVTETVMEKVRVSKWEDQELAQLIDYLEKKNLSTGKDDVK